MIEATNNYAIIKLDTKSLETNSWIIMSNPEKPRIIRWTIYSSSLFKKNISVFFLIYSLEPFINPYDMSWEYVVIRNDSIIWVDEKDLTK